ncbi:Gfo/Idh/MocA family protein [Cyclobacterium xiamenense]|uniref:Gfo/Idh/MocA family protein n=1 Tax=Cyclobacterium xiamenense TaxID=1297121 RepID=UPI0012B960C1|nr:Gfo/Idh/MocA family oxidoreductase [Cyclobacterium xiamenense]
MKKQESRISVGIIGAGNFSTRHIEAIRRVPQLRLAAICRRDAPSLVQLMKMYQVEGTTDYRQLLENPGIDALLIATPHHLHAEIAVAAAHAGKHILLEKPMATRWTDCLAIYDACKKNRVTLMLAQVGQFTPAFLAAKRFLHSGELGTIRAAHAVSASLWKHADRKEWHLRKESGGGYLFTVAVHQLDVLCALLPSEIRRVHALLGNGFHLDEVDDSGILSMKCNNGLQASLHFSGFRNGVNQVEVLLYGDNGTLKIGFSEGAFYGKDQKWKLLPGSYTVNWMEEALEAEWNAFANAVVKNEVPQVSGEHGLYLMQVLFAAKASAASGKEIIVPSVETITTNHAS